MRQITAEAEWSRLNSSVPTENLIRKKKLPEERREGVLALLLQIKDLHTEFRTSAGVVHAVDGISYTVERGETVAIVGESGSG